MDLKWQKRGDRVWYAYDDAGVEVGFVFGAQSPHRLWCAVSYLHDPSMKPAALHTSLQEAMEWVKNGAAKDVAAMLWLKGEVRRLQKAAGEAK